MEEIDQDLERSAHDRVRTPPLDVHDEPDATGIVLVARIVESLSGWRSRHGRSTRSFSHRHPLCENSCTILQTNPLLVIPKKFDSKYQKLL